MNYNIPVDSQQIQSFQLFLITMISSVVTKFFKYSWSEVIIVTKTKIMVILHWYGSLFFALREWRITYAS